MTVRLASTWMLGLQALVSFACTEHAIVSVQAGTRGNGTAGAPSTVRRVQPLDAVESYQPRTRTYYIAAEESDWNYAPDGCNVMMGRAFTPEELVFVEGNGVDRIGSTYRKAIYREYTDASFSERKARNPEDDYQGLLGPIIHGVVGDTIQVVFHNSGTRHYSIHAHGVLYDKASEGAETNDGTAGADKLDDMVEPEETYTYIWRIVERAGPGPADPSSIAWLYHSHTDNGISDEYAGLIGAIIVTDAAHGTDSGVASDIDRELVHLFMVEDENSSVLTADNIASFAPTADPEDEEFEESNLMHCINGYVYANGPHARMTQGDRVRWHLLTLGTEVDLHTPHWHGNTVLDRGHRTDVIELLPASMRTVDMLPDNPGSWMFHCHVNDHIAAGMGTLYEVLPSAADPG
jgi:FtsP/CotA-like multicopper oxidase with cupredoxin domain